MPDRATLSKIGFRSVPQWWLDKYHSPFTKTEASSSGSPKSLKVADGDVPTSDHAPSTTKVKSSPLKDIKQTNEPAIEHLERVLPCTNASRAPDKRSTSLDMPKASASASTSSSANNRAVTPDDGDLIDLSPSTPSSTSLSAPELCTPHESSASSDAEATPSAQPSKPTSVTKAGVVFVPRGESPEDHLSRYAKQRRQLQKVVRNPTEEQKQKFAEEEKISPKTKYPRRPRGRCTRSEK